MLDIFKNKLIIFEGIDNTGKTTVAQMLTKMLNSNGIETIFTFQPGDDAYGTYATFIRSLCKDKRYNLHPLANLFAFLFDRVENISKIVKPALELGKTVISDRWWYSTIAYQFYGKELSEKFNLDRLFVVWMNEVASLFVQPDIVYYFPEEIKMSNRIENENDQFDNAEKDFKERVKNGYEEILKDSKVIRIHPKESALLTLEHLINVTNFIYEK